MTSYTVVPTLLFVHKAPINTSNAIKQEIKIQMMLIDSVYVFDGFSIQLFTSINKIDIHSGANDV